MVRRTKEDAAATRQRLLDTAERVFLAHGVARTSLQHIADAAGVTRGAVYWHFKDKTDLFLALMGRVALPCEQCIAAAQSGRDGDALAALRGVALAGVAYLRQDEGAYRLFTIAMHRVDFSDELASLRERVIAANQTYITQLERLIEQAVVQGRLRSDVSPATAALGLFGLVDGLTRHATLAPELAPTLDHAPAAVDAFLIGLGAARPQATTTARSPRGA